MLAFADSYSGRPLLQYRIAMSMLVWGTGDIQNVPLPKSSHGERYQVGFCDDHVEFIRSSRLFSNEEAVRRVWNYDFEPHY